MESSSPICIPPSRLPATIISVKVSPNSSVEKETPLLVYEFKPPPGYKQPDTYVDSILQTNNDKAREELKSTVNGSVEKILVRVGDKVTNGQPVLIIKEPCSHAVQFNGLCALCGQDLSIPDFVGSDTSRASISMAHDVSGLMVSQKEAHRLERENTDRLLSTKRLSLIVDLDQTVIHATIDSGIGQWMKRREEQGDTESIKDIYQFTLPDSPIIYFVKLRPHLREFLHNIQKLYELHVYTMGTRNYAAAIAKIIDPDQSLFSERILSRDESGSVTHKTLQRLFPCDQSMVVVIDDRGDVWNWSPNLIKVQPYAFFSGIGDINAPPISSSPPLPPQPVPSTTINPSSQLSSDTAEDTQSKDSQDQSGSHDDKLQQQLREAGQQLNVENSIDRDSELNKISEVLTKLHQRWYSNYEQHTKHPANRVNRLHKLPDVKDILPKMKREVFGGCTFVFTAVIPIGYPAERSEVWNLALSFGAQCVKEVSKQVTHVIAGKPGTAKAAEARRFPNIRVVSLDWLLLSISQWTRLPELSFLLEPFKQPFTLPGLPSEDEDDVSIDSQEVNEEEELEIAATSDGLALWGGLDELGDELEEWFSEDDEEDEDESGSENLEVELDTDGMEQPIQSRPSTPGNLSKKRKRSRRPLQSSGASLTSSPSSSLQSSVASTPIATGTNSPSSSAASFRRKRRRRDPNEDEKESGEGSSSDDEDFEDFAADLEAQLLEDE